MLMFQVNNFNWRNVIIVVMCLVATTRVIKYKSIVLDFEINFPEAY